ncbi:PLP-dependent aminotransferase family protein [Streptomyces avicenniae]|uniref:MocR-like pyridoxine biosynthesis transcription factor PdxR n=1 Tax=Streptomyces avicenniae TaxID=500153 RepID=UPI000B0AEC2F|nr:PLP-dependent aminotransferase family protein [Streptomyces avicenniae]
MDRAKDSAGDRSEAARPRAAGAGSDFLQLSLGDAPPGGITEWLARRLRGAIADGRLPVGSRLPATRVLAAELRVSRGVVTEAYQRLSEDGHVAGHGRNGTVVVAAPVGVAERADGPREEGGGPLFTATPGPEAFDTLRTAPARIDLSPGAPDLAAFPRAAWLRAERAVLADMPATSLRYGDPRGAPELRRAVAHWLARNRGIGCEPADVLITSGVAQGIGLLADALRREGVTAMAFEEPGSLGVRQHLVAGGFATPPVRVDEQGVRVDDLLACGAAAVLLTPAHQFPTGVVLGGERRRALMRWAADGGLIVEDDYDAEHRYGRPPAPALRAMLGEGVCYAGSVSKLLAPAMRIGWLIAPTRYREPLVTAKRFADLGNAALPQLVLARLMESGTLERHLRVLRTRHRRRRDVMINAVRAHLPGAVVHGAAAGLHLMVTFGEDAPWDDRALAEAALALGVKAHPLSWHRQLPGAPGLVLGYASSGTAEIAEGVGLVGKALATLR